MRNRPIVTQLGHNGMLLSLENTHIVRHIKVTVCLSITQTSNKANTARQHTIYVCFIYFTSSLKLTLQNKALVGYTF